MRKFAKFVRNPLPGEKNGRKIGNMCFIAVSGAEEVNIKRNKIAYYIDYFGFALFFESVSSSK